MVTPPPAVAEVSSLYGSHNTSQRVQSQIEWSYENKQKIWKKVIQNKIRNQAKLLKRFDKIEWKILDGYISSVQDGDITNREGFAAKVYFNALFGQRFLRSDGENEINRFLDYGYSLILSTFNREIVKNGNLTQIGINHRNYFNQFNLSSDLMEPFRPIIDEIVYKNRELFFSDSKYRLLELFSEKYTFDGSEMYFVNIVEKYVKTILESLNKNSDAIKEF
jgi:CRISPR-associated endonuclease Cas1 subtype II